MRIIFQLIFLVSMPGSSLASYAQTNSAANQNAYFIQGAVRNPGVYRIESEASLLKLFSLAGGLTDTHGAAAFIIRRVPAQIAGDDSAFRIIQVRIDEVVRGNPEAAANLEPGDIVNVPQGDVYYVAGEVRSAGSFQFKEGVTLLEAISRASGVTGGAQYGKAIIFRTDPISGKHQEITVDLEAIKSGKQKDIPLVPNDIIVVPNARVKTMPRFMDAPPVRVMVPCRGFGPCVALMDSVKPVSGLRF
jgi:polysaccharide export outer membrane protein